MKKTWKQLLALIMAMAMTLSLCAPAWAAELESAEDGCVSAVSAEELTPAEEEVHAEEESSAEEESQEEYALAEEETASETAPAEEEAVAEEESPAKEEAQESTPAEEQVEEQEVAPEEEQSRESPAEEAQAEITESEEAQEQLQPQDGGIWEQEDNESFYLANEIPVNQDVWGNLNDSSDKDYYKFHLDADGMVSLGFTHPYINSSSDKYWQVCLYNSDETLVDSVEYEANNGNTTITNEVGLAAGTYYLKVDSPYSYHSASAYSFRQNFTPSSSWEKEFNESPYTATPMALNALEYGTIKDSNDVDYFYFTTPTAGYITVDFQHPYLDMDDKLWSLTIYNENEQFLDSYSYWGNTGDVCTSNKIGIPAGKYYVKVEPQYSYWSASTYQFKVNFTPASDWETEFNHDFYTADPIELKKAYHGTIMNGDDTDIYKFTLNRKSTIAYSFQHKYIDSSNNVWETDLYREDGTQLQSANHVGNTSKKFTASGITLPAGTYYLKVTKNYYYSTAPYTISINHAHHYTSKVTRKPTLSKTGVKTYTCKECGKKYTKVIARKKLPAVSSVSGQTAYMDYNTTKHAVKVKWSKVKGNGYQVQVSPNRSFSGKKNSATIKKANTTSTTIKVKKKGYYYVRVRAYKKEGKKNYYSPWATYYYSVYAR